MEVTSNDPIVRKWLASAPSTEQGGLWDWRVGVGDATEAKKMHEARETVLITTLSATRQGIFSGESPALAHRPELPSAYFDENAWRVVADRFDLSGRQLEVLRCLFDGLDKIAMAERLRMSVHTVHTHVGRLYRKFRVNSCCGLMVRLFLALLSLDDGLICRSGDRYHKQGGIH